MLAVGNRNDSETLCSFSNQILGAEELRERRGEGNTLFLPPSCFKAQEGLAMSASEGCDCLNRAAREKKTYCPMTGSSGFWGQAGAVWALEEERSSVFGKSIFCCYCPRILLFPYKTFLLCL